jgi:acyl transferase domain-containing protein
VFNLKGPSFVLDTACSSSLYALHMACTALNAGECDAAIVAGANLVQSPEVFIAMAKAGVLSTSSTSHTFDVSADGYGRGAALYLRRLEDVIFERGSMRSIIRGTAVNRYSISYMHVHIMLTSCTAAAILLASHYLESKAKNR